MNEEARIQEEVRITLEKKAGETCFRRCIEANDARAALNGLAILIVEYVSIMGLDVPKVLSLLAVSLMGPVRGEEKGGRP